MTSIVVNVIAFFLLAASLYLAYQAGNFRSGLLDEDDQPPVELFSIIVALAAYLLLVFT